MRWRRRGPRRASPPCAASATRRPARRSTTASCCGSPAPRTETGEDMAEFQVHGGRPSSRRCSRRSAGSPDAAWPSPASSPAAPSRTASSIWRRSRASPISSMPRPRRSGARRCGRWAARCRSSTRAGARELIGASALVEAAIDFTDEGDVASDAFDVARNIVAELQAAIARASRRRQPRRDPARRLPRRAGRPAQRRQVEPAECAGAARRGDRLGGGRHHARRHRGAARSRGLPVIVTDTAGIREPQGAIEQEGIRRTLARAREADLVLWLSDASDAGCRAPAGGFGARGQVFPARGHQNRSPRGGSST